jgi:hypothetical protein
MFNSRTSAGRRRGEAAGGVACLVTVKLSGSDCLRVFGCLIGVICLLVEANHRKCGSILLGGFQVFLSD